MPDPMLTTRISLPLLRHILVPRKKVLGQLTEGMQEGHLLTLASAPAGYGKTTTIRIWVKEAGQPVAWVTLEKSDNELKQFLTYVLTALQQIEEDLSQTALEVVENTHEADLQHVLGSLINDLCGVGQLIILALANLHSLTANGRYKCILQLNPS